MKNTQKKLKAKHFRYLSKKIIKNPLVYIHDFFQQQTDIVIWQNDINLFITTGVYPAMCAGDYTENGYNCHRMIKQIEIAYVIFKQCGLPKHKNPLRLFDEREDYFNYSYGPEFTCKGKKNPYDLIRKFFSYQPLQEWYKTMDLLMEQLTLKKSICDKEFSDKIVVIREFLIRLAYALYYIYENEGITITLPPYVNLESKKAHQEAESNNEPDELFDEPDELFDDPDNNQYEENISEMGSTELETNTNEANTKEEDTQKITLLNMDAADLLDPSI